MVNKSVAAHPPAQVLLVPPPMTKIELANNLDLDTVNMELGLNEPAEETTGEPASNITRVDDGEGRSAVDTPEYLAGDEWQGSTELLLTSTTVAAVPALQESSINETADTTTADMDLDLPGTITQSVATGASTIVADQPGTAEASIAVGMEVDLQGGVARVLHTIMSATDSKGTPKDTVTMELKLQKAITKSKDSILADSESCNKTKTQSHVVIDSQKSPSQVRPEVQAVATITARSALCTPTNRRILIDQEALRRRRCHTLIQNLICHSRHNQQMVPSGNARDAPKKLTKHIDSMKKNVQLHSKYSNQDLPPFLIRKTKFWLLKLNGVSKQDTKFINYFERLCSCNVIKVANED